MSIKNIVGINDVEYLRKEIFPILHQPYKRNLSGYNYIEWNLIQIEVNRATLQPYPQLFFLVKKNDNKTIVTLKYSPNSADDLKQELFKLRDMQNDN